MACPTGRCALRRFDGHGTNNYRPTNPEAARQFNLDMERMMAERSRQDGCWLQAAADPAATAGNSAAAIAGKFPGAGLLRQMTPEPSSPRFAAAAKSPAGNSAAAEPAAADPKHCWALSS